MWRAGLFQRRRRAALLGADFSPLDLAPVLWLRADSDNVTLTGTDVEQWDDLSASGADYVDVGSNKPTYVASDSDFGGHGSIEFSSVDRLLIDVAGAATSSSADFTMVIAHKSATADDNASHILFDSGEPPFGSPNRLGFFWGFGGVNKLGALTGGAVISVSGTTQTTDTRHDTWVLDDTANTLEVYEDGVSAGTVAYTAANNLNTTQSSIGVEVSGIRAYSGKVAEIILFDKVLSSGELSDVWTYIEDRYSL